MQKDFHYYVIYALAKEAGYSDNDAYIIAYASQYVDDNTDREYTISDDHGEFYVRFPDKIGNSGDFYFPIITQAVDITSFKLSVQRYVYAIFHFLPGDNDVEINGKKNFLCTTRGCKNAVNALQEALKNGDIHRIGVALHTYADTWSHERFSGFHEDWNKVHESIIGGLPPNIGHAEVFNKPDEISIEWIDKRFGKEEIKNRERALLASEHIFDFIKKGRVQWNDVKSAFEDIINAKNFDERIKKIKDMYPGMADYDEDKWINEALDFQREQSELPEQGSFIGTPPIPRPRFVDISIRDINANWFRFQNAAKKQLSMVLSMVEAL
jgi:hypothetical protein